MFFCNFICPYNFFYRQIPSTMYSGSTYGTQTTQPQGKPIMTQVPPGSTSASPTPVGPPPPFIPNKTDALYQSIEGGPASFQTVPAKLTTCRFQYVYIWLRTGAEFWSWVSYIFGNTIHGWVWSDNTWTPLTLDIRNIEGAACYNAFL